MGVSELLLGVWVFQKDPKSSINRFFALFSLFFAGWTAINGIEVIVIEHASINLWDRFLFFSAYSASYFFLLFAQAYPTPRKRKWLNKAATILLLLVTCLLFLTDAVISVPTEIDVSNQQAWFPLYIVGFLINWCASIFFLWQNRRRVPDNLRRQVDLLLTAIVLGSILGMATSFVMPRLDAELRISQLWPPGVAFIIFIFSVKVLRMAYKNSEAG
jgi:uncharacterized membrane protein YfcA